MDGTEGNVDVVGSGSEEAGEADAGSTADPREISGGDPRESGADGGGESAIGEWEGAAWRTLGGLPDAVVSVGKR